MRQSNKSQYKTINKLKIIQIQWKYNLISQKNTLNVTFLKFPGLLPLPLPNCQIGTTNWNYDKTTYVQLQILPQPWKFYTIPDHSHPSVSSVILDSPRAEQRRAYNSPLHWDELTQILAVAQWQWTSYGRDRFPSLSQPSPIQLIFCPPWHKFVFQIWV